MDNSVRLTPEQEAKEVARVHKDKLEEGQHYAVLEAKWYQTWCHYSGFNPNTGQIVEGKGSRPGPIDNSRLSESDTRKEILKATLAENEDFTFVHEDVWKLLFGWYGGGPVFIREVIAVGVNKKQCRIELYPTALTFIEANPDTGAPDPSTLKIIFASRKLSFERAIRQWGVAVGEYKMVDERVESKEEEGKEKKEGNVRVWLMERERKNPDDEDEEMRRKEDNLPKKKLDWKLVPAEALSQPLESFDIISDTQILVERKKADGNWPRVIVQKDWRDFEVGDIIDARDTVGKWYESKVIDVKPDKIFVHYIGWAQTWDEWLQRDSERLAPKNKYSTGPRSKPFGGIGWSSELSSNEDGQPPANGAVGLRNLGNTCFMNSTLQCLSNTPILTDFFIEDKYLPQINRDNPLGWHGRVADEYALLLKDLWSGKYRCVAPRKFKEVLGEFAPRFSGYQQQDSSELLSFLLDGLHEDLNQVKKKPPTQAVESKNRPDEEVANEAWETYLKRNRSVVVDLLQGQLKSKLDCPDCGKISITFDPFMFLSVPLPTVKDKIQEVILLFAGSDKRPTQYGCTVSKVGRISELKKVLSELSGVPAKRMVVADVWNHRIYRFLDDDSSVSEIRTNDNIFVYEVPAFDNYKANEALPVQVLHLHMEKNPHYDASYDYSKEFNIEAMGTPRVVAIPRKTSISTDLIRKQIVDMTVNCVHKDYKETAVPFKIMQLDTTGRTCGRCNYASHCSGCELPTDNQPVDLLGESREANLVFGLLWTNKDIFQERYPQPVRDKSAELMSDSFGGSRRDAVKLYDCIRAFTTEEILSENDPWYCSDCKQFRQAKKKFDLWRLPDILIVHLKRFSYTKLWRDKISTFVDFPLEGLDAKEFVVNPVEKETIYDLFAVSNHMGGMGGGHYTAYCKNLETGKWFLHDDSRVSAVPDISDIKSESAYVLFYRRRVLRAASTSFRSCTGATYVASTSKISYNFDITSTSSPTSASSTASPSNGSSSNGSSSTSNGSSSNGSSSNGSSSNGSSSNGSSSNGTSSNGTSSDGTSSNGTSPNGTSSNGSSSSSSSSPSPSSSSSSGMLPQSSGSNDSTVNVPN